MAEELCQSNPSIPCTMYRLPDSVSMLIAAAYVVAFERGHEYMLVREIYIPQSQDEGIGNVDSGKVIFIDEFGDERALVMTEVKPITTNRIACQWGIDPE